MTADPSEPTAFPACAHNSRYASDHKTLIYGEDNSGEVGLTTCIHHIEIT